jgi:hypothetical protein
LYKYLISSAIYLNLSWETYNSDRLGLSIKHPSTWDIHEKENRFEKGVDLGMETREESGRRTFSANLENPTNTTDIAELTDTIMDRDVGGYFDINREIRLMEATNTTRYTIDGEKAGSFITVIHNKNDTSDLGIAAEWVVTTHNGRTFVFIFSSPGEDFDTQYVTEMRKQMFDSIKWQS